ncbi:hypothetical protein FHG87_020657 [Trinorchestia longiramus]|nr:hypothetical protein FHG87_020657 [Trinorchestia longiramus]
MDKVFKGRPYVFQQDSATSHKAIVTQDDNYQRIYSHATCNLGPPNSPDLNPMDYYVWSDVESKTNRHPYSTIVLLKAAIVPSGDPAPKTNHESILSIAGRSGSPGGNLR